MVGLGINSEDHIVTRFHMVGLLHPQEILMRLHKTFCGRIQTASDHTRLKKNSHICSTEDICDPDVESLLALYTLPYSTFSVVHHIYIARAATSLNI